MRNRVKINLESYQVALVDPDTVICLVGTNDGDSTKVLLPHGVILNASGPLADVESALFEVPKMVGVEILEAPMEHGLPSVTQKEVDILRESGVVKAIRAYRARNLVSLMDARNAIVLVMDALGIPHNFTSQT